MTDIIRTVARFIRANSDSTESLDLAATLDDMMNCRTFIHDALLAISTITGHGFGIIALVPNNATAFVFISVRELRRALAEKNTELAYEIADILQNFPDDNKLHDQKAVLDFNKAYIWPFNGKHLSHLPEIV